MGSGHTSRAFSQYKGPSLNDVTHLGGTGDLPKGDITP